MPRDLKEIVADLDIVKTWFSPGSARHRKITGLADELAEQAGGRKEAELTDPAQPTPGPGVKAPAGAQVVDSVGEIEDTAATPPAKPSGKPADITSPSS